MAIKKRKIDRLERPLTDYEWSSRDILTNDERNQFCAESDLSTARKRGVIRSGENSQSNKKRIALSSVRTNADGTSGGSLGTLLSRLNQETNGKRDLGTWFVKETEFTSMDTYLTIKLIYKPVNCRLKLVSGIYVWQDMSGVLWTNSTSSGYNAFLNEFTVVFNKISGSAKFSAYNITKSDDEGIINLGKAV